MGIDAVTSGGAFAAAVNAGQAMSQTQVAAAASIRMQKVSMGLTEMAGSLIDQTLEKMAEMGATVSVLA